MSEKIAENTVKISESDVRHAYLPFRHIFDDLFPEDCLGGDDWEIEPGVDVTIFLEGIVEPLKTDIYRTKKTPRRTGLVRDFYKLHNADKGTKIFVKKTGEREFRVSVID